MFKPDVDHAVTKERVHAPRGTGPRYALICAALASIVACVPPNGGMWGAQQQPQQGGGGYGREQDYDDEYGDDGAYDGTYDGANNGGGYADPSTAGPGAARGRGPAPASRGGAANTCNAVCSRIAQCRITSFDNCMDACGEMAARGQPPAASHAKDSCESLRAVFARHRGDSRPSASGSRSSGPGPSGPSSNGVPGSRPVKWYCTAEATLVYQLSDSSFDNEVPVHWMDSGMSRDAASVAAHKGCLDQVTVKLNGYELQGWITRTESECHITNCYSAK